jgi:MFS family permease
MHRKIATSLDHGIPAWQRRLGPYSVLDHNRPFALLFGAYTLSTLIDWLYVVALFILAYRLTHAGTVVALLTLARLLPYAFLVPVAGAITDRVDRKLLMVVANGGRALVMLCLLLVHSTTTLPLAFPLVFVAALLSSLFRPALLASVPSVVPETELVKANTIMGQVDMASFGAGPAIAGFILVFSTTRTVLLTANVGLLLAAAAVSLTRIPPHAIVEVDDSWRAHTLAGLRFLSAGNDRALLAIAISWAGLTLFGGAYWALSVVLAAQAFHLGTEGIGFLNAAYAAGGLLGGFLIGPLVSRRSAVWLFVMGAGVSSIAEVLFGLSPAGVLPFFFWFLTGFADAFAKITAITVIQAATPRRLLGRVFGAFEATIIGSMLVGALVVSPAISLVGARAACAGIALVGLILLLSSIPILVRKAWVLEVRVFLLQVPVLNQLPVELLDTVVQRLELERFAPGQTIILEGDTGDTLYLIKAGNVDISHQSAGQNEVALSTLSRGDYFGEIALLHDVPRTATCRAVDAVELYTLHRSDFQTLRDQSENFDRALQARSEARVLATRNRLLLPA